MSLSLTAKKGTKETPQAELRSLINCSVRPEQLNSGFSGINGYGN